MKDDEKVTPEEMDAARAVLSGRDPYINNAKLDGGIIQERHFSFLQKLQLGGCTCHTKTDELQFHAEDCQFRLAREIELAFIELGASARALGILLREKKAEIEEYKKEIDDYDELNGRLSKLLTGVADVLKGKPETNTAHSWHDLPERAKAAMGEIHYLRTQLNAGNDTEAEDMRAFARVIDIVGSNQGVCKTALTDLKFAPDEEAAHAMVAMVAIVLGSVSGLISSGKIKRPGEPPGTKH